MNELERDLRTVLEKDAERAPLVTRPPADVRRRIRRRRFGTITVAAITTLVVATGAVVALSHLPGGTRRPADSTERTRTSTVRGVTLAYPTDLTLAELTDEVTVSEGRVGPEGTITGQALFELANFDPMDTGGLNVSCDGGEWNQLPPGGAMLFVQTLDFPRVPGTTPDAWPVELGRAVGGATGAAAPSDEGYATWTAQGRVYEGFLCGRPSPALEHLRQVFASMTFGPERPGTSEITVPGGMPVTGPIYVLDSGTAEGQRWNLLAFASRYPLVPARICIDLEVEGRSLGALCDLDVAAVQQTGGDELSVEGDDARVTMGETAVLYAWGAVSTAVDTVSTHLDAGEEIALSRIPLPPSFDAGFDAVVVVGSDDARGEIRSESDGDVTGQAPFFADSVRQIALGP